MRQYEPVRATREPAAPPCVARVGIAAPPQAWEGADELNLGDDDAFLAAMDAMDADAADAGQQRAAGTEPPAAGTAVAGTAASGLG